MNNTLAAAAVLSILLGVAHSYLGERYILIRLLRRDNLPKLLGSSDFTKQSLRLAWHITTVLALGLAGLLMLLAMPDRGTNAILTQIISVSFAISGLLALILSRGRHLSWIIFLCIAALAWYGA